MHRHHCSMSERIAGQRFICDTLLDVSTRVGKDRHARTLGDLCPALHRRHAAYGTRVALPCRFRWRDRNLLCRGSPAAASPCRPQRGAPGSIRRLGCPRCGHCRDSVLAVGQNGHAVAFRTRDRGTVSLSRICRGAEVPATPLATIHRPETLRSTAISANCWLPSLILRLEPPTSLTGDTHLRFGRVVLLSPIQTHP
jgi:hypothetical protein